MCVVFPLLLGMLIFSVTYSFISFVSHLHRKLSAVLCRSVLDQVLPFLLVDFSLNVGDIPDKVLCCITLSLLFFSFRISLVSNVVIS